MDNRAIGVFDSGFGGLTAVRTIRRLLPDENIIYFADSGRAPYGGRSREELAIMAQQDLSFLMSRGVKAIVAACGTVSSNVPQLLEACPVKTFGVVKSAARAMAAVPGSGPIGIIATEASIRSGGFKREIQALGVEREMISCPCPDFVPLIESGHVSEEDKLLTEAVERYLRPMKQAGVSALLLGCTHYGIISRAIGNYLGEGVELVSAADSVGLELKEYIDTRGIAGSGGQERFYTSGEAESFRRLGGVFLGRDIDRPEHVAPMEVKA